MFTWEDKVWLIIYFEIFAIHCQTQMSRTCICFYCFFFLLAYINGCVKKCVQLLNLIFKKKKIMKIIHGSFLLGKFANDFDSTKHHLWQCQNPVFRKLSHKSCQTINFCIMSPTLEPFIFFLPCHCFFYLKSTQKPLFCHSIAI